MKIEQPHLVQANFARNPLLEDMLKRLNGWLSAVGADIPAADSDTAMPMVFIVGAPRSGTTLLTQWLADSGVFAYPSNFISRFYHAPYVGALVQRMMTDPALAFRNEMEGIQPRSSNFHSELGKTDGFTAPNEFHYFWRRFFHYGEIQLLSEAELADVDVGALRAEIAALIGVMGRPLAMKGLMFNWNLPFIASVFPQAIFLHIRRNPVWNAQSLLLAREKYFQDRHCWYSFKPPEYCHLRFMEPLEQVCGQVAWTEAAIEDLPDRRVVTTQYEDFCSAPKKVWEILTSRVMQMGVSIETAYAGPPRFDVREDARLLPSEIARMQHIFYQNYHRSLEAVSGGRVA